MLLADQNDEDRLFQVQAIFWCVVSMQICCFSSNMAYNHVMTKKKVSWKTSRRVHIFARLKRA